MSTGTGNFGDKIGKGHLVRNKIYADKISKVCATGTKSAHIKLCATQGGQILMIVFCID